MTIYEMAKLANVSPATVSRVLNNKPGIKLETRQKVEQVLKENNYVPSAIARGLANKSMKMIGLFTCDIRNDHHSQSAYAIQQEFTSLGYHCVLCSIGKDEESQKKYFQLAAERQYDGIILIGSTFSSDFIKKQIKKQVPNLPIIIANGSIDLPNVCSILVDEISVVKKCVDLLYENGHRNIVFVQYDDTSSAKTKEEGYIKGMKKYGLKSNVVMAADDLQAGITACQKAIAEDEGITAFICGADITALGVLRGLKQLGYNIPDDKSVIGYNNSIYAEISLPKLTSIDNKLGVMGNVAAKTLYSLLQNEEVSKKIIVSAELVVRDSVGEIAL